MIIFNCTNCGKGLKATETQSGKNAKCPNCGALVLIPEARDVREEMGAATMNEGLPPLGENVVPNPRPNPTIPTDHKLNWLARYKNRCGVRSFIFQAILAGWTAFMALVTLGLMLFSASSASQTSGYPYNPYHSAEANAGAFALLGICCPVGTYLLIAIPLGIAAIATLERHR
jgi:DNA-directed RNA polymerase subunit RPC12/RpoP